MLADNDAPQEMACDGPAWEVADVAVRDVATGPLNMNPIGGSPSGGGGGGGGGDRGKVVELCGTPLPKGSLRAVSPSCCSGATGCSGVSICTAAATTGEDVLGLNFTHRLWNQTLHYTKACRRSTI